MSTTKTATKPTGTNYGYARISTRYQHEDRQLLAFTEQGIDPRNVFLDKQSGKDFERTNYRRLLKKLKPGDCLFLKSLDRFGRSYAEIIEQWRLITKEKQADIVVMDMPLLDTRAQIAGLTGVFLCDIVLAILSYVAELERTFNHERQTEGIAVAKAKGVKFGRPLKDRPHNFDEIYAAWIGGETSVCAAAKALGVAQGTFKTWATGASAGGQLSKK
ncbi:MAG: recombinase family protein [Oscillospiraceae bacterium]|jgi:DNA invertase Pin-like site-specific DNA recombinase|nr:recombinase family protein [Oscillospiraceae bacterium]